MRQRRQLISQPGVVTVFSSAPPRQYKPTCPSSTCAGSQSNGMRHRKSDATLCRPIGKRTATASTSAPVTAAGFATGHKRVQRVRDSHKEARMTHQPQMCAVERCWPISRAGGAFTCTVQAQVSNVLGPESEGTNEWDASALSVAIHSFSTNDDHREEGRDDDGDQERDVVEWILGEAQGIVSSTFLSPHVTLVCVYQCI